MHFWAFKELFQKRNHAACTSFDITWRTSLGLLGVKLLLWVVVSVLLSGRVFILGTATDFLTIIMTVFSALFAFLYFSMLMDPYILHNLQSEGIITA